MNSEVWLRAQYQAVVKERDQLQENVRILERENSDLKRAVQDLSLLVTQRHPDYALHVGERRFKRYTDASFPISSEAPLSVAGLKIASPQKQPHENTPADDNFSGRLEATLESELKGHVGSVYCAGFSCDGRFVASGGLDQTVRLWDGAKGYKQASSLSDHSQLVSDVLWTHAKPSLFSVSYDKSLRAWDVERGVSISNSRLRAFGTRLAHCSSSNALITLTSSHEWHVLDTRILGSSSAFTANIDDTVRDATTYVHRCLPTSAVCLDDGFSVVLGDAEGRISLYDLRKGVHKGRAAAANDSAIYTQSVLSEGEVTLPSKDLRVLDLSLCSSGDYCLLAAQCSDNAIRIFDVLRGVSSTHSLDSINSSYFKFVCSVRGHEVSQWPIRVAWWRGEHFNRRKSLSDGLVTKQHQRFSGGSAQLSPTHRFVHDSRFSARRSNSMNALLRPASISSTPPLPVANATETSTDEFDEDLDGHGSADDGADMTMGDNSSSTDSDEEINVVKHERLIPNGAASAAPQQTSVEGGDELNLSVHGFGGGSASWDQSLVLATGCSSGRVFFHDVSVVGVATERAVYSLIDASGGAKVNGVSFGPSSSCSMLSYGVDGVVKVWSLPKRTNNNKL